TLAVLVLLFSGLLPRLAAWLEASLGRGSLAQALLLVLAVLALDLMSWPFDYWRTFRLEALFGFNQSTPRLWLADHSKGLLIQTGLILPLLLLLSKLVGWLGPHWWLTGFAVVVAFQVFLMIVYP